MSVAGRIELPDPTRIIPWTQVLLDSHARLTGEELIARSGDARDEAERVFLAPFVVASHDSAAEPILNYGNRTALALWGLPWERFVRTPSRATAEIVRQEERQRVLEQVGRLGYMTGYTGVRISAAGRRFRIHDVTIWDLCDGNGRRVGQAATFRHWTDE
ncbi:MAG: MEKHLA domain-containing protein [Gammaproteobacteria bacterium]|nr:MEKHLA domain-containing protein [Gammaproteobacteria bacterium]MCG3143893.1 hypothetical protein [Gammaproteobacteria bacterium]